ncbi:DUF1353 domain-containing protein [Novosphingobium album (ex Liu et al. 2023)]|uniref:DUF1353 domain-containing protein n=1 Tax=Novosphingobium album (ex Liu et al. 2023) TaxID=3031130 RepID=A0ABT5WRN5_9SPHN|nr:DUF1353 domain-containing protein [Novosphingobium album (ex Liu et al. 2023)]MDE8652514.1 DUF1353 domain-containing protein [Novosphingobium album (ex Liu et al. 2023)]
MTAQSLIEEAVASVDAMTPAASVEAESTAGHGTFFGIPVKIEFDLDGRSGRLLEPIRYVTQAGVEWPVPQDAWLDGASIPRAFWSIIGGPYEGRYREPSVVHDHYCIVKSRGWKDTHRMFHEAMLCREVPALKARLMFYAVYRFGPRWRLGVEAEAAIPPAPEILTDDKAASIVRDARIIAESAMSMEAIEQLADASRAAG